MRFVRRTVAAAVFAPLAAFAGWIAWPLPARTLAAAAAQSLTIEDRHGLPLRSTRASDGSLTRWLPLAEAEPQLIQAFVAVEDRRFFTHHGIDPRAIGRALLRDRRSGVASGASTITMQLARLVRPTSRGWIGKVAQAAWALRIEAHLTKQQILEQYLNRVPLGQGTVGVEAAAALYFNGSAARLSLGQSALLAGLAQSPAADNPFANPARARARRAGVLRRMVAVNYASPADAGRAAREPVAPARARGGFLAPHFTSHILELAEDSGAVLAGRWRTSLDLGLQSELEGEVRTTVSLLRERGVAQAAAVVLDNRTGEVLAWVGSPDFWADSAGQVDMVISPRQPGSALKPFLYGLAFDRGYSAASVLPDIPRTYQTATGPYQPRNYDRRFHGPVRMREALASSFNVPAVELTSRLGAPALLRVLHAAGFASLTEGADHYGMGLALGNGDVTLLELANAYRVLARGGVWRPWRWNAAAPGDRDGGDDGVRVVSAPAAALLLDILSDPVARAPGFGLDTPFDFEFPAAVKTGTSHHFTDNWAVGVTGGFTVAVWAGNFSGRPMQQVSGVTGAGPLLHHALVDVARHYDPGTLPSPASVGAVRVTICRLSGLRAGADCPGVEEWELPGAAPLGGCDWHRRGGVAWPAQYADWVANSGTSERAASLDLHGRGAALAAVSREFRIVSPQDGDRYQIPPGGDPQYATVSLRAVGAPVDEPVRWLIDGRPTATTQWQLRPGAHEIRAIGASGRSHEISIIVR